MVMGMQGIPGLEGAYDATMSGLSGANDLMNFQTGDYSQYQGSQYGYNDPSQWGLNTASQYVDPSLTNFEGGEANQYDFMDVNRFTPAAASRYMSPYMQNVVDVEKDQAMLDFQRSQANRDAQAVNAGAFGGTREGVVQGLAYEDLARQMGGIQARGQQSAYQDAQNMFGEDRATILARDSERAGENARIDDYRRQMMGLETDTRLGAYDLAGRLFGADRDASMTTDQARAAELARYEAMGQGESQFGGEMDLSREQLMADLLGQGAGMSADIGSNLLNMGAAERQAILEDAQLREQIGADIEGTQQGILDVGYEDYLRQLAYPKDQLNMYSSIIQGMGIQPDTAQQMYMARSPYQDAIGAGISALGLYNGLQ